MNKSPILLTLGILAFTTHLAQASLYSTEDHDRKVQSLVSACKSSIPTKLSKDNARFLLSYSSINDLESLFKANGSEQAVKNAECLKSICLLDENNSNCPFGKRFNVVYHLSQKGVEFSKVKVTHGELDALEFLLIRTSTFDSSFKSMIKNSVLNDQSMFDYFVANKEMLQKDYGYMMQETRRLRDEAYEILNDRTKAYPALIEDGEGFINKAEGRFKDALDNITAPIPSANDESYEIDRFYSNLHHGFNALEEAFKAHQKAQTHFGKMLEKNISFDSKLTSRINATQKNLITLLQQVPQINDNILAADIFPVEAYKGAIEKRASDMQPLLMALGVTDDRRAN